MAKRALILIALLVVLAMPFALRPRHGSGEPADETLVVITPHNEAIRYEFGRGFSKWYKAKTGRSVRVDWRVIGGTSDIARYLESTYAAAFETEWSVRRHERWGADIQAGFQNAALSTDAPIDVRRARQGFLDSRVGCGIDVFFGGDAYQYEKDAAAGRLVDCGVRSLHPDWFRADIMPDSYGGEPLRDRRDRWFGVVLSSYGILFNRDAWRRRGIDREPQQWTDLADFRLIGQLGLADPTKSGSVCEAFENIIQQTIQRRVAAPSGDSREAEVAEGWADGLRLIQRMGANARYFTDSSQKPPIDVSTGDCAAGLCIDFYGRQQQEAVRRRGVSERLEFVAPRGGSAVSADPIGLLRGAPHPELGLAFIEFALSPEGQFLWALRPGTPGGPERFALRRKPIRADFYRRREIDSFRSDPNDAPFSNDGLFVYHPEWTGPLFREIGFVTRVMCLDTHDELVAAWRSIRSAPPSARNKAMAALQDMSRVDYHAVRGEIHARLSGRDWVDEVRLATELSGWFRDNYRRARQLAEQAPH